MIGKRRVAATPLAESRARSSRWFLLDTLRQLWHQFREDCRALPEVAWRRWKVALALGFVITTLVTLGLTFAGQYFLDRGLQSWDERTLRWVVDASPLTFENGINWESPGSISYLVPVVAAVALFAAWRSRPLVAISIVLIHIVQHAFIFMGWGLWNRDRPKLIADGVAAPELHSFPSGHASLTMSVYGFIIYLLLRATHSWAERALAVLGLLVWAGLVGVSRLELGSHWPSDIIAGSLMGLSWLLAVVYALRQAERAAVD